MVKRYEFWNVFGKVTPNDDELSEAGEFVSYDDYAALLAENERLKSEAGYTAADVATAAADGFRDGVRSVDLEQFRDAVESCKFHAETDMIGGYRTNNPELIDDAKDRHLEAEHLLALIDAHKGE